MFNYLSVFIVGFMLSVLFMLIFRLISIKYKILNLRGVSLFGGLGLALSMLASTILGKAIFGLHFVNEFIVINVAFIILIFGIFDDIREMSVLNKLLVQSLCAVLLISFGIRTDIVYIGALGNIIVTYLWIIGITNAKTN